MISTKQIFWNVRRKVYEKGKSLHEASKEASIGVNTIAWMQNNYPGVYILGKLADYIGCPITDFFRSDTMRKLWIRLAATLFITGWILSGSTASACSQSTDPIEYEGRTAPEYTTEDIMLLAEVMYHENHWNGDYIMLLTGSVVLNRVKSKEFPNTIHNVLFQRGQYATTKYFGTVHLARKYYHMAEMLLKTGAWLLSGYCFRA